MPTKTRYRINEAGIYSHIYNKGIDKRTIFIDEEDYQVFVGYLEDYLAVPKDPESKKKDFEINGRTYRGTPHQPKNYFNEVELIAYSLKPDHFHLLLHQVTIGSLEKLLRSLSTRYSMYFNKKYKHTGSLFEGPYKSISIKNDPRFLAYLTHTFHKTGSNSSYPEYLGKRLTPWIKSEVVVSLFKAKTKDYRHFIEKYVFTQKGKELVNDLTFSKDTECLERRGPISTQNLDSGNSGDEERSYSRKPHFLGMSIMVFFLLVTLGLRNISVYSSNIPESVPKSHVLPAKTEESIPPQDKTKGEAAQETVSTAKAKVMLTVQLDTSSSINIRQKPTVDSEKIGKTVNGERFEFVSQVEGWYEVRLENGSTGFISEEFIVKEEAKN